VVCLIWILFFIIKMHSSIGLVVRHMRLMWFGTVLDSCFWMIVSVTRVVEAMESYLCLIEHNLEII